MRKCLYLKIISVILIFINSTVIGQNTLDSLKTLSKSPIDTVKLNALIEIYNYYSLSYPNIALKYAEQALTFARKINNKEKQVNILLDIGITNVDLGNNKLAKNYFEDALPIAEELKNLNLQARCYGNLGNAYSGLEDYNNALLFFEKTLVIFDKLNDKNGLANVYGTLGNLYSKLKDDSMHINRDKAYTNYKMSKELFIITKSEMGVATNDMNLGSILQEKKKYDKALELFFKAKIVFEKHNHILNEGQCLSNIGNCYSDMRKFEKAMYFYKAALDKFKSINSSDGLANLYNDIAKVFIAQKKYKDAISYLQKSIDLAKELEQPTLVSKSIEIMCSVYDSLHDYKNAFFYKSEYVKYIQEIDNIEINKKRERLLAEFDTKQKILLIEKKEAEINKQQLYMIFLVTAIALIFIILLILINRFKIKQKANNALEFKNKQITQKNEEIVLQRDQINIQKTEIEKQHFEVLLQKKDITDSIIYAKRIQTALLPSNEKMKEVLRDGFCLFQPRDIVSGDFYWVNSIGNISVIVAADSTGHGVPGAFMSIIGMNFLDEIINKQKILSPAEILNKLRKMIIEALSHSANLSETKDGMDMSICVLNNNNNTLQYAGAYNPLYVIARRKTTVIAKAQSEAISYSKSDCFVVSPRNDETSSAFNDECQLIEYKADRMPIGYSDKIDIAFTNREIQIEKGDSFYLFSDGYIDQFGGTNEKKFRSDRLKSLLLEINNKPMHEQKNHLEQAFSEWRGKLDQIDDLLIIGFKL